MGRKFIEVFLGNLLIVVALIPAVILVNTLMSTMLDNFTWMGIGIGLLGTLSYLSYKLENKESKKV